MIFLSPLESLPRSTVDFASIAASHRLGTSHSTAARQAEIAALERAAYAEDQVEALGAQRKRSGKGKPDGARRAGQL